MLKQAKKSDRKPNKLGFGNCVFLNLIPIATGYAIASAPAQAATLTMSDANFLLNNFSHSPTATSTKAEAYVSTNAAPGSSVVDSATAYAVFEKQNPTAYNTTLSMGIGEGNSYLGTSNSKATVIGNFLVGTNDLFKFNFSSDLNLKTSIDTYFTETAKAAGNVYFMVLDTTNSQNVGVLDYFLLSGNLATLGGPDYLYAKKSNRVQLNSFSKQKDFIGNEESASGSVTGSYRRYFNKPTNLTVLEVKENSTKQEAKNWFSRGGLQTNTSDAMLSGATDLNTLDTSLQTSSNVPILSDSLVTAMGPETSQLDTAAPTLSQNEIASAIGNKTFDTQGSYDSSKMTSGDMKTAIANNSKAQTWLAGKTQYTSLLPDTIAKDVQSFSNVSNGAWVDPPTTYGLEYTVEGDSLITNILDFFTDDADDLFTVAADGKTLGQFKSGDNLNFVSLLGKGVSNFTITDIDPAPGKTFAEFNFMPLFNTKTANLKAIAFDKSANKSVPEPGSVVSLLALSVVGVTSRLFAKR